jgi:hypothetical protein
MAVLLSLLSAADGRHVNDLAIETWHEVAGHLDFTDARDAVMDHVATSTKHMTLAEMIQGAEIARESRTQTLALTSSTADTLFDEWCLRLGTTSDEYLRHKAADDRDWLDEIHGRARARRAVEARG